MKIYLFSSLPLLYAYSASSLRSKSTIRHPLASPKVSHVELYGHR
ncbi:MAG: hypothetical protein QXP68_06605 [Thermosphaera sp.]